jgi:hypothetical protein
MYAGIDYGLGRTNIDHHTHIRYGVICQNTVGARWYDEAEAQYPEPQEAECPQCSATFKVPDGTSWGDTITCDCGEVFEVESPDFEEPAGWSYVDDEYTLQDCLDSDIMVIRSPYYTHARFCSPCVPGAGDLEAPMPDGPKTYCLGHDWFEEGKAPYPVFRVSDDRPVYP